MTRVLCQLLTGLLFVAVCSPLAAVTAADGTGSINALADKFSSLTSILNNIVQQQPRSATLHSHHAHTPTAAPDHTTPTLKFWLDHSVADLVKAYSYPLIVHQLKHIDVPNQSISKLGDTLELSKITLHNGTFAKKNYNVYFHEQQNEVQVLIQGFTAIVTADWYFHDALNLLKLRGTAINEVKDTTIDVRLSLNAQNGAPVLALTRHACYINKLEIHLFGDGSQFFQRIAQLAEPTIRDKVQDQVSSTIQQTADNAIEKYATGWTMTEEQILTAAVDLYYGLVSDNRAAVHMSDQFVELALALQFQSNAAAAASIAHNNPFKHHGMSDEQPRRKTHDQDKLPMIAMTVDDYVVNSLFYVAANVGLMTYLITPEMLPSAINSYLNTDALEQVIPELTAAYPHRPLHIMIQPLSHVGEYDLPSLQFDPELQGMNLRVPISIGVSVLSEDQVTVPLLQLGFELLTSVRLNIQEIPDDEDHLQQLIGNVTVLEMNLHTITQQYDFSFLIEQTLTPFLRDISETLLRPTLNDVLSHGVALPTLPFVTPLSSEIQYTEGLMSFLTDFSIHLF